MLAAKQLNNELLSETWLKKSDKTSEKSIVSYLMIEEVKPSDRIWQKICEELDKPLKSNIMTSSSYSLSKNATIAALILGATVCISAILYFLI